MKIKLLFLFLLCTLFPLCGCLHAQTTANYFLGTWQTDSVRVVSTNEETKEVITYKHSFKQKSIGFMNPPISVSFTSTEMTVVYMDGSTESGTYTYENNRIDVNIMIAIKQYQYAIISNKHLLIKRNVQYVTDGINPTLEEHLIYLHRD